MNDRMLSRRKLLGRSAQAAAVGLVGSSARSAERVAGSNDRLSVGIVGPGSRGTTLMEWINRLSPTENVQLTATAEISTQQAFTALHCEVNARHDVSSAAGNAQVQ